MNFEALITEMKECTKANAHGECYAIAADWLFNQFNDDKADELANTFVSIANRHNAKGYLCEELNNERHIAYTELKATAERLLTEEEYKLFYGAM